MDESRTSKASFHVSSYFWGMLEAQYAGEYRDKFERISGYRGPRRPGSINACKHQKVEYQAFPIRGVREDMDSTPGFAGTFPVNIALGPADPSLDPRPANYSSELVVSISNSDTQELLRQLAGEVQPAMSLPNMILELPQTLTLWKDLKEPLLAALSLQSKSKHGKHKKRLKDGSNALLAQQFGLLPLVGDLKALLNMSQKVHSEVARISKLPTTWSKASKKCSPSLLTFSSILESRSFGYSSLKTDDVICEDAIVIHYEHQKAKSISGPQLVSAVTNKLMGMTNPAAVLWEATPFSFVADWFFPIGEQLRKLDGSSINDLMLCRHFCTTVKAKRSTPVTITRDYFGPMVCGIIHDTHFRRYDGLPPVMSLSADITMPGIRQFVLGGALALQRL